jgi:transposase
MASQSREKREQIRLKAGKLFKRGFTQAEVSRKLKVSTAAANYWHKTWKKKGIKGLKSKGHPGFASGLDAEDREAFRQAILEGPLEHGFETDLWTLPKLAKVLKKVGGFSCSEVWTWHIVRSLGFTPQKPEVKPKERNEQSIAEWKTRTLPGHKKMGGQTWVLSGV